MLAGHGICAPGVESVKRELTYVPGYAGNVYWQVPAGLLTGLVLVKAHTPATHGMLVVGFRVLLPPV